MVGIVHEEKKPFACQFCNDKFTPKEHLKQHVEKVHEINKPLACQYCDDEFYLKAHLRQHVEAIHKKKN